MTAITVLLLLLNIALLAGVGHILYREMVTIRMTRQQAPPQLPAGAATIKELQTQLETQHQTELERLRADARTTINELTGEVGHLHVDVSTLHGDVTKLHGEVSTLRGSLGTLPAEVDRLHGELATLSGAITALAGHSTSLSDELAARPAPAQAPVLPELINVSRTSGPTGAVSELYAQLARLEVAFLTLANPVLLPGEPFEHAEELPPETLRWESWKDIGDQTFGFAELYAAKRVLLDAAPRAAAGQFITGVRELLTTRIYPTLTAANRFDRGERAEKVKAAIAEMGRAIETVRDALEGEEEGGGRKEEGR